MLPIHSQEISFFLGLNWQFWFISVFCIFIYLPIFFSGSPICLETVTYKHPSHEVTPLHIAFLCCDTKLGSVFFHCSCFCYVYLFVCWSGLFGFCWCVCTCTFLCILSLSISYPLHFNVNYNKSRADTSWLFTQRLPQKAPAPNLVFPDGTVI